MPPIPIITLQPCCLLPQLTHWCQYCPSISTIHSLWAFCVVSAYLIRGLIFVWHKCHTPALKNAQLPCFMSPIHIHHHAKYYALGHILVRVLSLYFYSTSMCITGLLSMPTELTLAVATISMFSSYVLIQLTLPDLPISLHFLTHVQCEDWYSFPLSPFLASLLLSHSMVCHMYDRWCMPY